MLGHISVGQGSMSPKSDIPRLRVSTRVRSFKTEQLIEEATKNTMNKVLATGYGAEKEIEYGQAVTPENTWKVYVAFCKQVAYDLRGIGSAVHLEQLGIFVHVGPDNKYEDGTPAPALDFIFEGKEFKIEARRRAAQIIKSPIRKFHMSQIPKLIKDFPQELVQVIANQLLEQLTTALINYAGTTVELPGLGEVYAALENEVTFDGTLFLNEIEPQGLGSVAQMAFQSSLTKKKMVGMEIDFGKSSQSKDMTVNIQDDGQQKSSIAKVPKDATLDMMFNHLDWTTRKLNQRTRQNYDSDRFHDDQKARTKSVASGSENYPELLDVFSRTRSAPIREELEKGSVSGEIGTYYSPIAGLLKFDPDKNPALSSCCLEWRLDRAKSISRNNLETNFTDIHKKYLLNDHSVEHWQNQLGGRFVEDGSTLWKDIMDAGSSLKGFSIKDFLCILTRYENYVESIPDEVVSPYNKQWLMHADVLLSDELLATCSKQTLKSLRYEIYNMYFRACKESICNYAFLDLRTRERTAVLVFPEPIDPWGDWRFLCLPKSLEIINSFGFDEHQFGVSILHQAEVRNRLQLLNVFVQNTQCARELLDLFYSQYQHLTFADLPPKWTLADIETFRTQQDKFRESICKTFTEDWSSQVLEMVRDEVANNLELEEISVRRDDVNGGAGTTISGLDENGNAIIPAGSSIESQTITKLDRFYDSVAVLLSLFTRFCVQKSLDDFVTFFKRFEPTAAKPLKSYKEVIALQDDEAWEDAFLINKLTADVKGDVIKFRNPLEVVQDKLVRVFRDTVLCLNNIERPDSQLAEAMHERLLMPIREEEIDIQKQFFLIDSIISQNTENVKKAIGQYDEFLFLLQEQNRVTTPFVEDDLTHFYFESDPSQGYQKPPEEAEGKKKADTVAKPVNFDDEDAKSREHYKEYLDKLIAAKEKIRTEFPSLIRMRMIVLDCRDINELLIGSCQSCIDLVKKALVQKISERNHRLCKRFEYIDQRLQRKPTSEEALVEVEADLELFRNKDVPALMDEYKDNHTWFQLAWEVEAPLQESDYKAVFDASKWMKYQDRITTREKELSEERDEIEDQFLGERTKFMEWIDSVDKKVDKFKEYGNARHVDEYLDKIQMVKELFKQVDEKAEEIAAKEELLGWDVSEFTQLQKTKDKLVPFENLWNAVRDHQKLNQMWFKGPIAHLDANICESDAQEMWQTAADLQEIFKAKDMKGADGPADVAKGLQEQLEHFKEKLPLLKALCNEGMRERHWDKISNILGFAIEPDNSLTLNRVLDMEIEKYTTQVVEVSNNATKEFEIEQTLDEFGSQWEGEFCEVSHDDGIGLVIQVQDFHRLNELLDNQIKELAEAKASPAAKFSGKRIATWEEFTSLSKKIVDLWIQVQQNMQDMQLLASEMDPSSKAGQCWSDAENTWRSIMDAVADSSSAMAILRIVGLFETLQACQQHFENFTNLIN